MYLVNCFIDSDAGDSVDTVVYIMIGKNISHKFVTVGQQLVSADNHLVKYVNIAEIHSNITYIR